LERLGAQPDAGEREPGGPTQLRDADAGPNALAGPGPLGVPTRAPLATVRRGRAHRPRPGERSLPTVEEHARAHGDEVPVDDRPVGHEPAHGAVIVDDAERTFERRRRRAELTHALLEDPLEVRLTHARLQRVDRGAERAFGDRDRGADALDL